MTIVPYEHGGPAWVALQNPALELANQIAGTDFVPTQMRGNAPAIAAAILFGAEVGLGPMMSLSKIAVINGRPTIAAEAQRALILRAGHDIWIEESTATRCIVAGRRRGSEATSRVAWSLDDAKRAGLAGKPPWRAYPRQMLLARASAELARAVFPDAIGGLAATEELDEEQAAAQASNGVVEAAPAAKTTRRRRASVSAPATTPQPPAPAEPELPPLPGEQEDSPAPAPASTTPAGDRAPEPVAADPAPDLHDSPAPAPAPPVTPAGDREPAGGADQPAPDLMTGQQRKLMMKLFTEKGFTDRNHRLAFTRAMIRRPIESSNELTEDEASRLIDILQLQSEGYA